MKILYLSKGDHVDYQDDCLSIGLKELFGSDVVDLNKRSHIYTSYDEAATIKLYGMGMSVTRILEDLEVDRDDIGSKIKNKYFDLIVYGSIWRCSDYIQEVLKYYPSEKIVVIDGEDEVNMHPTFQLGVPYFKRELIYNHPNLHPISFAIPTCKVNLNTTKIRDYAICDPRDKSTYIYKTEMDYYQGYKDARFAYSMKKAGWDCMRHYEIMANGGIPIFLNIDDCPSLTMVDFPKSECSIVARSVGTRKDEELYDSFRPIFEKYIMEKLSTKALASKVITTLLYE